MVRANSNPDVDQNSREGGANVLVNNWFEGRDEVGRQQRLGVTADGHYVLASADGENAQEILVEAARRWMRYNGFAPPPYVAERLFATQSGVIEKETKARVRREVKWYRRDKELPRYRRQVLEEHIQAAARQTFGRPYAPQDVEFEVQVWAQKAEWQQTVKLAKTVAGAAAARHWSNVSSGQSRGWL